MLPCHAHTEEPPRPISHQDLAWFPAGDGSIAGITTAAEWERRRAAILAGFQQAAGRLPARDDLPSARIEVVETLESPRWIRRKIRLDAGLGTEGDQIPAYLYLPREDEPPAGPHAGIVALHPTHAIGKGVVDGQSERPNRAYARELAERGFVVIAPDYPSFGDLRDHDFAADRGRFPSGTLRGIWNHLRCVDLLTSLPEVDAGRIGAIGHSLGGHNAIFLGAFDPRVKAVVSSCGWTPFHDYYGGDLKGWTSDRYLPSLRERFNLDPDQVPFDFPELVAALAPRAFFSNSPLGDDNFDFRGVEKAAPAIRRIYALLDASDRLRFTYPDCDHDFPPAVREEAYRWLEKCLAPTTATR